MTSKQTALRRIAWLRAIDSTAMILAALAALIATLAYLNILPLGEFNRMSEANYFLTVAAAGAAMFTGLLGLMLLQHQEDQLRKVPWRPAH